MWLFVSLMTFHPASVAALYLSQSLTKPAGLMCRPPLHMPPSISISVLLAKWAKSARHFLPGKKRYSRANSPPLLAFQIARNLSSSVVFFAIISL